MKGLVLAAGLGTRLAPHTRHRPKPLFTAGGRTLLGLAVEKLAAAGCEAVAVNTHHLSKQIRTHMEGRDYGIPVLIRHEPEILGTGGAVANLRDFWDDRPFWVINADILFNFDLKAVCAEHLRRSPAATLVLADDPEFNAVHGDDAGRILGFHSPPPPRTARTLTFTGIQILDPVIFDYLPPTGPSHSIDVFKRMIEDGADIRAFMAPDTWWRDLGTPERYGLAVAEFMAARYLGGDRSPKTVSRMRRIPLAGDGSDRGWMRFQTRSGKETASVIAADHGIRQAGLTCAEMDAFVEIGGHLRNCLRNGGVTVPRILAADRFAGIVLVEDLGDLRLETLVRENRDSDDIRRWYRSLIDAVFEMSVSGAEGFRTEWCWQTPRYDEALIAEKECRYFLEAFVEGYLGITVDRREKKRLDHEFGNLGGSAVSNGVYGFMHRDLQSRNIMVRGDRFYFIDFQGGRLGPVQYDLASLLLDPYAALARDLRKDLEAYAFFRSEKVLKIDPARFRAGYESAALCRTLQTLGAFGFLTRVRKKAWFEAYVPTALKNLEAILAASEDAYPRLFRLASVLPNHPAVLGHE